MRRLSTIPRPTWRRAAQTIVAITVVGAIFFYFLPRLVDYEEVWAVIRAMTWLELLTLGVLAVWNQATYWLVELAARPGLTYPQAIKITQASTAMSNTLPGGVALGAGLQYAMYVSYRFAPPDIAVSLTLTGIWNTFAKLGMPIIALALLAISGSAGGGFIAASIVGLLALVATIAGFAVVLRSENGASNVGRRLGALLSLIARVTRRPLRGDWAMILADFRRRTVRLLTNRWVPLTAATLVSHFSLYMILLLTLRHVGISNATVGWEQVLASFAFVRLLSALPITPGGVGVVELGLAASLIAAGGEEALVVAAVLVYRLLTFVLPIPFGVISYFIWRQEAAQLQPAES